MKEHFTLKKCFYLLAGGEELDLHNNFVFVGLDYSIAERVLVLRWLRSPGDWVSLDSPSEVELEYRDVARFELNGLRNTDSSKQKRRAIQTVLAAAANVTQNHEAASQYLRSRSRGNNRGSGGTFDPKIQQHGVRI